MQGVHGYLPRQFAWEGQGGEGFPQTPTGLLGLRGVPQGMSCRAISLVLGPDMGGSGERLTVRKDGSRYLWEVDDGKGHVRKLATDTRRANGY